MPEAPSAADDWTGLGFVPRTLRTAAVVGIIVVGVLASYEQFWAIGPFLFGLGLSSVLLRAWDIFVRGVVWPGTKHRSGGRRRWPIIVFSLIKYPLVGLLLYTAVRIWHADANHVLAFLGGFILLHLLIGLRAFNRALKGHSI